jgi:uncharacterized protein (DUF342 family)
VRGGRIVGGEIVALGGIETGQAGSTTGLCTQLTAGEDFALPGRIERLQSELERIEEALHRAEEKRQRFQGREEQLPAEDRAHLAALDEKITEVQSRRQTIEEEIDAARRDSLARSRPEIKITGVLYPDTRILMSGQGYRSGETVHGPLRVALRDGEIALFAATPG